MQKQDVFRPGLNMGNPLSPSKKVILFIFVPSIFIEYKSKFISFLTFKLLSLFTLEVILSIKKKIEINTINNIRKVFREYMLQK